MIKNIRLRNFKAHSALELLNIPLVNVIIGKNNSGKSSILQAVTIPKYGYGEGAPAGPAEDLLQRGSDDGSVQVTFSDFGQDMEIKLKKGNAPYVDWKEGGPKPDQLQDATFYISPLRAPRYGFQYLKYQSDVGMNGEQTWNILHQLKANEDPSYGRIVGFLKGMGMGISGIGTPTKEPGTGEIRPVSFGNSMNLMMNGAGTWSALPILTQGVLCGEGNTLLIEEPEIHLHRAAIDGLWQFIGDCANRGVQVICTSHSVELVLSMGQQVDAGVIPKGSRLQLIERNARGQTSISQKDPTWEPHVAKQITGVLASLG